MFRLKISMFLWIFSNFFNSVFEITWFSYYSSGIADLSGSYFGFSVFGTVSPSLLTSIL